NVLVRPERDRPGPGLLEQGDQRRDDPGLCDLDGTLCRVVRVDRDQGDRAVRQQEPQRQGRRGAYLDAKLDEPAHMLKGRWIVLQAVYVDGPHDDTPGDHGPVERLAGQDALWPLRAAGNERQELRAHPLDESLDLVLDRIEPLDSFGVHGRDARSEHAVLVQQPGDYGLIPDELIITVSQIGMLTLQKGM